MGIELGIRKIGNKGAIQLRDGHDAADVHRGLSLVHRRFKAAVGNLLPLQKAASQQAEAVIPQRGGQIDLRPKTGRRYQRGNRPAPKGKIQLRGSDLFPQTGEPFQSRIDKVDRDQIQSCNIRFHGSPPLFHETFLQFFMYRDHYNVSETEVNSCGNILSFH